MPSSKKSSAIAKPITALANCRTPQRRSKRSYLDWNATTPLRPQAQAALSDALAVAGNPSSVHAEGRTARRLVARARQEVAALVGAQPGNVSFTSGGTEANMLALTKLRARSTRATSS